MNDIVGVNTRAFELAAAGACQVVDHKDELPPLFKPGEEVIVYRDLPRPPPRSSAITSPIPTRRRAIGDQCAPPRPGRAHAASSTRGGSSPRCAERCGPRMTGSLAVGPHVHRVRTATIRSDTGSSARPVTDSSSCATTSRPMRPPRPRPAGGPRASGATPPCCPISDLHHRVTLGEGRHAAAARLSAACGQALGVRALSLKLENPNPTGTVKDRSSATAVARARQFGFRAISVVSSGNAGSSIAAYAARAGLRALVFAYARTAAPKLLQMAATTPDLVPLRGRIRRPHHAVGSAGGRARLLRRQPPRATLTGPGRRRWRTRSRSRAGPGSRRTCLVAPVAVGETFIATARGFREMAEAGWIPSRAAAWWPRRRRARMPIVRAFRLRWRRSRR